jgi:hypothetical protein
MLHAVDAPPRVLVQSSSRCCPSLCACLVQLSPNLQKIVLDGCTEITDTGIRYLAHS